MTLANPGFADPVLDSQACFRAVLDAMSRPGTIHTLATPADPPAPLHRATAAALLTLVDADTPIWLDAEASAAAEWIAFHCGAPVCGAPVCGAPICGAPVCGAGAATFALALRPVTLARFAAGSDEGPEEGATLILQVAALGAGRLLTLEGPGLAAPALFQVDGLPAGFVAEWGANHALFPRGIDLILCADDRLAAFPRTLRIREG